MIEKIKAWLDAIKEFVLYVVGPIAFGAGIIYGIYMRAKAASMEKKLQQAQQQIGQAIDTAQQAGKVATDEEADYDRIRDEYKSGGSGEPPKAP